MRLLTFVSMWCSGNVFSFFKAVTCATSRTAANACTTNIPTSTTTRPANVRPYKPALILKASLTRCLSKNKGSEEASNKMNANAPTDWAYVITPDVMVKLASIKYSAKL